MPTELPLKDACRKAGDRSATEVLEDFLLSEARRLTGQTPHSFRIL